MRQTRIYVSTTIILYHTLFSIYTTIIFFHAITICQPNSAIYWYYAPDSHKFTEQCHTPGPLRHLDRVKVTITNPIIKITIAIATYLISIQFDNSKHSQGHTPLHTIQVHLPHWTPISFHVTTPCHHLNLLIFQSSDYARLGVLPILATYLHLTTPYY